MRRQGVQNFKSALFFIVSVSIFSISYQNCSKTDFSARDIDLVQAGSAASVVDNSSANITVPSIAMEKYVSAKSAGTIDANCLNNSQYDACLFWKNPVAQNGAAFSNYLSFGKDLSSVQTFGVQLSNLKNNQYLESDLLYIYVTNQSSLPDLRDLTGIQSAPRLKLQNGQLRTAYKDDGNYAGGSKATAQLMAYFWLNHMFTNYTERAGTSYSNLLRKTYVDAFADFSTDTTIKNNSYFTYTYNVNTGSGGQLSYNISNQFIFMGYMSDPSCVNSICHEMALSSEVYLHEMGHGSFLNAAGVEAALSDADTEKHLIQINKCSSGKWSGVQLWTQTQINQGTTDCDPSKTGTAFDFSYISSFCKDANGCIDAINEGQADFHFLMMFPEKGQLAETIVNNIQGGLPSYGASRDVTSTQALSRTVQSYYTLATRPVDSKYSQTISGEVHGMGSAYASILWKIYTDSRIDTRKFEKAFFNHLRQLSKSSDFSMAWSALQSAYVNAGGDAAGIAAIYQAFSDKGVKP